MKTEPEQMLDKAFAQLRHRAEPAWVRRAGAGLEARVRQRLIASAAATGGGDLWPLAWNWPSLGLAGSVTAAVCLWSGWGPLHLLRESGFGFGHWAGALTGHAGLFF